MAYRVQYGREGVEWLDVHRVLTEAGLSTRAADVIQKAFENSFRAVFVFDADELIGVGRAICDGAYEAAIYDVAVLPAYQGKKVGRLIIEELHKGLAGMNVVLFARPSVEPFYQKLGYSRMLTGMAKFTEPVRMREKGFTE